MDAERDATNFSYVSWGDIADALGLVTDTRTDNDPRFAGERGSSRHPVAPRGPACALPTRRASVACVTIPAPDNARQLHDTGQDALLELELATLEMNADEKWMLEQLLLTYVADSVPPETWTEGLAAGVRAVRRDRARRTAESLRDPSLDLGF